MLRAERRRIDEIDVEIVRLLEERMKVVNQVAAIKKANRIAVLDAGREKQVLQKIAAYVEQPAYRAGVIRVYEKLLDVSKEYQEQQIKEEELW